MCVGCRDGRLHAYRLTTPESVGILVIFSLWGCWYIVRRVHQFTGEVGGSLVYFCVALRDSQGRGLCFICHVFVGCILARGLISPGSEMRVVRVYI